MLIFAHSGHSTLPIQSSSDNT